MSEKRAAEREVSMALRRLLQGGRSMQAALARRVGVRLTDVQAVDTVVSAGEPLGPVELGHRLGIRSASATALVDRLVTADHLARTPDPRDRRRVALIATEHARGEVRAALSPLIDDVAAITARLDDAQVATVLAFLNDVTAAMHGYAARHEPTRPSQ
jgi:DNA-binding MarR family transcriptional regulator